MNCENLKIKAKLTLALESYKNNTILKFTFNVHLQLQCRQSKKSKIDNKSKKWLTIVLLKVIFKQFLKN